MSAQSSLFGERLPDMPGKTRGIVGLRVDDRGRNRYTLQCENCLATEEPEHLVFLTFKFHTHHQGENPRLCPSCRLDRYAKTCTCDGCQEDEKRVRR